MARPRQDTPPSVDGPRINSAIRTSSVRCIDPEGNQMGILATDEALRKAAEFGMDLVEIQPNAEPPVCKILDYGKYKFQAQKRASEARKKQKIIEVKEIKLRPNIDSHDYDVKMRAVRKFLDGGDKVKVTLRFRGREMAHIELGAKLLERVRGDVDEFAKVEAMPKMEGRQMIMVLGPK
ncbi:MAG: translation initiation factor IF-3 [Candidatus Puniceispirillaceae bacterium]|nr:translation initiation factor IF-3 [Alphaproteobacteria bacterium]MBT5257203.1 translation initiation factor IF-3 [Alphaproteobacteria bacterium]MDA8882682.1 translation initiation factor IF-3 [Alphaproteobacteria bacterium]MDB0028299.1 translation initiation factor IF-3 [Alphaproteobacteria bacterium]MDG1029511.1 translation initiation factor IF-3 [Alphaproteobacteria bacterium]